MIELPALFNRQVTLMPNNFSIWACRKSSIIDVRLYLRTTEPADKINKQAKFNAKEPENE
jgi:hypothetical protein